MTFQKEQFDSFFKGFIMVSISIIGFFVVRMVGTVDRAVDNIENLKISTAVMQSDMSNFKESWKVFIETENAKQREHYKERTEDAKK